MGGWRSGGAGGSTQVPGSSKWRPGNLLLPRQQAAACACSGLRRRFRFDAAAARTDPSGGQQVRRGLGCYLLASCLFKQRAERLVLPVQRHRPLKPMRMDRSQRQAVTMHGFALAVDFAATAQSSHASCSVNLAPSFYCFIIFPSAFTCPVAC